MSVPARAEKPTLLSQRGVNTAPRILPVDAAPDVIELAPDCRVPILWKRSSRARRLSLRIDPLRQAVTVTLPGPLTPQDAMPFLKTQRHWITKRLAALHNAPAFLAGKTIPVEGISHLIVHQPAARSGVWIEAQQIFVSGTEEFIGRRVRDFLRNHARTVLGQELRAQAQATGLRPTRLDIRDTSSRWGSCSSSGRIMLSWRLIMAPASVRHYLIAHELAHLRHMNHSPAFWALVDQLTPHRHTAERWLKHHGSAMLGAR